MYCNVSIWNLYRFKKRICTSSKKSCTSSRKLEPVQIQIAPKNKLNYNIYTDLNPILHRLFQAGFTLWGGEGLKVPAAFFSEVIKSTTIKLGTCTLTN